VTDRERGTGVGPVTYNLDKILDAHTHLSGSQSGESTENILECMDVCGVEKAFIFAPELDVETRRLSNEHLDERSKLSVHQPTRTTAAMSRRD
jgi:hypothetical protein